MSSEVIIADTSCLIILHRINALFLLNQVFGIIKITKEVHSEFSELLPEWIEVVEVQDAEKTRLLGLNLDAGEASAIVYCLEHSSNCLLVIDERKGRKVAQELGIKIVGTLGVLVKAKEKGIIPSVKTVLENLEKEDFRISSALKDAILKNVGENN